MPIRTVLLTVLIALGVPSIAEAKTETLRVYEQFSSFTYTAADGTVTNEPPAGPPQAGDVFQIDSVLFKGTHRKHAKRATMSNHLECRFGAGPEPECRSWVAIGGALLRFQGDRVVGGAGRYLGATGRILSNTEVPGGNDIVARVTLR